MCVTENSEVSQQTIWDHSKNVVKDHQCNDPVHQSKNFCYFEDLQLNNYDACYAKRIQLNLEGCYLFDYFCTCV